MASLSGGDAVVDGCSLEEFRIGTGTTELRCGAVQNGATRRGDRHAGESGEFESGFRAMRRGDSSFDKARAGAAVTIISSNRPRRHRP